VSGPTWLVLGNGSVGARSQLLANEAVAAVLNALDAQMALPASPVVLQAVLNLTRGQPITAPALASTSPQVLVESIEQAHWLLVNTEAVAAILRSASRVLDELAEKSDDTFLAVLVLLALLGTIVFLAVPVVLLDGLRWAWWESVLAWRMLEAVPRRALRAAASRHMNAHVETSGTMTGDLPDLDFPPAAADADGAVAAELAAVNPDSVLGQALRRAAVAVAADADIRGGAVDAEGRSIALPPPMPRPLPRTCRRICACHRRAATVHPWGSSSHTAGGAEVRMGGLGGGEVARGAAGPDRKRGFTAGTW
jgi:hypothetical protein